MTRLYFPRTLVSPFCFVAFALFFFFFLSKHGRQFWSMRDGKLNARQFWNTRWINNGAQGCLYAVGGMSRICYFSCDVLPIFSSLFFFGGGIFFSVFGKRKDDTICAIGRNFVRNYQRKCMVRLKFRRQTVHRRNTVRLRIWSVKWWGCKRSTFFQFQRTVNTFQRNTHRSDNASKKRVIKKLTWKCST